MTFRRKMFGGVTANALRIWQRLFLTAMKCGSLIMRMASLKKQNTGMAHLSPKVAIFPSGLKNLLNISITAKAKKNR